MATLEVRQALIAFKRKVKCALSLLLAFVAFSCASSDCMGKPPTACDAIGDGEVCDSDQVCDRETCGCGTNDHQAGRHRTTDFGSSIHELSSRRKGSRETGIASYSAGRLGWSSHQLPPPGDLVGRIPYTSLQQYYYHRPYSPSHVSTRTYSQGGFDEIYQKIESQVVEFASESMVSKDRAFEFTDWQEYRRARRAWEARTGVPQSNERAIPDEWQWDLLPDSSN